MKLWLKHVGVFLVVITIIGILILVSGVVPIKASSGHFAITKWFLSFAMARSVATHSIGIEPSTDLDDASLVMKGAGYYQIGCASCHGSPIQHEPRVAQRLTPTPPNLSSAVSNWTPAELFYLVKHGVKLTGMPAFPSQQRDDEVWAVVAFLLALPELEPKDYRELVFVDPLNAPQDTPRAITETCAHCHGIDGMGRSTAAFPSLAGLSAEYLTATMQAYISGQRHSGIMEPIAARLDPKEIDQIASYYSSQSAAPKNENPGQEFSAETVDQKKDLAVQGEQIATEGLSNQDVGACVACHRLERVSQNPHYPSLIGQPADYLVLQLELFKQQQRGGTDYAELMHPITMNLEPAQMRQVAQYYASVANNGISNEPPPSDSE